MSDLIKIRLEEINDSFCSLRSLDTDSLEFVELRDSIAARGVLKPVLVRPSQVADFKYDLIDGLQRYGAALQVGLQEINACVTEATDDEILELQVVMNAVDVPTRPVDFQQQLQRMMETKNWTINQVAARVNKSPSWVSGILQLFNLLPSVSPMVNKGEITLGNGISLAKLPTIEQNQYVGEAIALDNDEFNSLVVNRLKQLREASRSGSYAVDEFIPIPKYRKLSVIRMEIEKPAIGPKLIEKAGITDPTDAFVLALKYVLHLDQDALEAQRAKFDKRRLVAEANERRLEREKASR